MSTPKIVVTPHVDDGVTIRLSCSPEEWGAIACYAWSYLGRVPIGVPLSRAGELVQHVIERDALHNPRPTFHHPKPKFVSIHPETVAHSSEVVPNSSPAAELKDSPQDASWARGYVEGFAASTAGVQVGSVDAWAYQCGRIEGEADGRNGVPRPECAHLVEHLRPGTHNAPATALLLGELRAQVAAWAKYSEGGEEQALQRVIRLLDAHIGDLR